jgi:acyl-CoA thioester hydrolase
MNARHIYAAFDDATGVLVATIGADFASVAASGLGWADVHQEIEFLQELANGAALTVTTTLLALGRSSITFRHDLTAEGSTGTAARLTSKTVRFDTAARRSAPIEGALRARIEALLPSEVVA